MGITMGNTLTRNESQTGREWRGSSSNRTCRRRYNIQGKAVILAICKYTVRVQGALLGRTSGDRCWRHRRRARVPAVRIRDVAPGRAHVPNRAVAPPGRGQARVFHAHPASAFVTAVRAVTALVHGRSHCRGRCGWQGCERALVAHLGARGREVWYGVAEVGGRC